VFRDVVADIAVDISAALEEFSAVNREAAETVKDLLKPENVDLLYQASRELEGLDESALTLYEASVSLRGLGENANTLHVASQRLQGLEDNAFMLHSAGRDLRGLDDNAFTLYKTGEVLKSCQEWVTSFSDSVNTLWRLQDHLSLFDGAARTIASRQSDMAKFVSAVSRQQTNLAGTAWRVQEPARVAPPATVVVKPSNGWGDAPFAPHFRRLKFRYGILLGMALVVALELFGLYVADGLVNCVPKARCGSGMEEGIKAPRRRP